MDLNRLLLWLVGINCTISLTQAFASPQRIWRGPILVNGIVLGATLISSGIWPERGGFIGALLWGMLLLGPALAIRHVSSLIFEHQSYQKAQSWSRWLGWAYQLYSVPELPDLIRALDLANRGETEVAEGILTLHPSPNTVIGRLLVAELYRLWARWEDLLRWLQHTLSLSSSDLKQHPPLALFYLRALGETGERVGLLKAFDQIYPTLQDSGNPTLAAVAELFVFAFWGDEVGVSQLFEGSLSGYPDPIQRFWYATAALAAGNHRLAHDHLEPLQSANDLALQSAVHRRLHVALPDQPPPPAVVHQLEQLHQQSPDVQSALPPLGIQTAVPYATYGILSLNLIYFAVEVILGGSTDEQVLYYLGALVPGAVLAGDWWRPLTATLLHYGPLHLSMNMLGLLVIGPFVEKALGIPRYLLTYWGAGIGSMAMIVGLAVLGVGGEQFVVGASGCIMGLVGATAAILLLAWRRDRSELALRRLRLIGLIIGLQIIFDLTTPQISVVGHASGLVIGFALGGLLRILQPTSR